MEQIKFLQDPKTLSDEALWYIIINVFPETRPYNEELRKWYEEIEIEFSTRKVTLKPIMQKG